MVFGAVGGGEREPGCSGEKSLRLGPRRRKTRASIWTVSASEQSVGGSTSESRSCVERQPVVVSCSDIKEVYVWVVRTMHEGRKWNQVEAGDSACRLCWASRHGWRDLTDVERELGWWYALQLLDLLLFISHILVEARHWGSIIFFIHWLAQGNTFHWNCCCSVSGIKVHETRDRGEGKTKTCRNNRRAS
jgi:hypothetical protein